MTQTAYCPKSHTELASVTAGKPYGHVPGHRYHDVDVVISTRDGSSFRVHVCEHMGSAQGRDEEHDRREVVGRGGSIGSACDNARIMAKDAGIVCEYFAQALSQAQDEAEEATN